MASTTVSERRQATILFADISGFTSMSERLDAEEVTAIVNECFAELGRIVSEQGGVIDKFIGDCVMALFGLPKSLENASGRAVEAGLRMTEAIEALNARLKLAEPLGVHVGINSGEVVAGMVGTAEKSDYTVMGDTVNLASRLKDQASRGEILVGPGTARAAGPGFAFEELKPIAVKGKSEPVLAFRLKGRAERRQDEHAGRAVQSPLVGRAEELGLLEERMAELGEGRGSVVFVLGEAGVGKSRLCAEFYSGRAFEGARLLEGRCLSVGRTASWHPLVAALKSLARIGEDDDEETAFPKLEAAVREAGGDSAEVLPYLALMMGYKLPEGMAPELQGAKPENLEKLLAIAMRKLLAALAAARPLVLAVEDLHWADESTLGLLGALMGLTSTAPFLLLLVARPGFEDSTDLLLRKAREERDGEVLVLELSPLDPEATGLLARNLLNCGDEEDRIVARIIEKAGGNPFFVEEVVRSLLDSGALRREGGQLVACGKLSDIDIPDSVDAVIMTRVDRLDTCLKELLVLASVIGRSFFLRILARVDGERESLPERLERLDGMQLIRMRRRLDEVEYLFKHVLVQETIYRSILLKRRKELHRLVAQAIEGEFPARIHEFYATLAWHYGQSEDFGKAAEYLEKAGAAALEAAASSEALILCTRALELWKLRGETGVEPGRLAAIEAVIGRAFHAKGNCPEAIEHLDKAMGLYGCRFPKGFHSALLAFGGALAVLREAWIPIWRSGGSGPTLSAELLDLMIKKTWILAMTNPPESMLWGFRVFTHCLRLPKGDPARTSMLLLAANWLFAAGLFTGTALRLLESARPYATGELERCMLKDVDHWAWWCTGKVRSEAFDKGISRFFRLRGDISRSNFYNSMWGHHFERLGDFSSASELAAMEGEMAAEFDNADMMTACLDNRTIIALTMEDWDKALGLGRELVEEGKRLGQSSYEALHLSYVAEALLGLGRMEECRHCVDRILEVLRTHRIGFPIQYAPGYSFVVRYCLKTLPIGSMSRERAAKLSMARKAARRMLRLGRKLYVRKPGFHTVAGDLEAVRGHRAKALGFYGKALDIAQREGMAPDIARTYASVARFLDGSGGSGTRRRGGRTETFRGHDAAWYEAEASRIRAELGIRERSSPSVSLA